MKIEAVTLRELHMPLKHFFETSFGRTEDRRVLLITAHCEGVEGWAECVAGEGPFFSSEWVETAWATTREFLAPLLIGQNIAQAKDSAAVMSRVRGHNMAKAALENALWDAEAKAKGQPLPLIAASVESGADSASAPFCYTEFYAYESACAVIVADLSPHFRWLSWRERVASRTGGRVVNGSRL